MSTTTTDRGPDAGHRPAAQAPPDPAQGGPQTEATVDLTRLPDPPVILLPGAADVDADAEPVLHLEPKLRARRVEVRRAARRHQCKAEYDHALGIHEWQLLWR